MGARFLHEWAKILLLLAPLSACADLGGSCNCSAWQFDADQTTDELTLNPITLPRAWTMEAWMRRDEGNSGARHPPCKVL